MATLPIMKARHVAIIAGILVVLSSAPSGAGGSPEARLNAEALIKACFDQTIGRLAGTTSANREANVDYNLCLEERIIDQFRHFKPDLKFYGAPEDNRSTVEKAREELQRLRSPVQRLYDWIYNYNPGCKPSCGTMYDSYHLIANGEVLEKMLRDVVSQRIEYGF